VAGLTEKLTRLRHRLLPNSLMGRSLLIIMLPVLLLQMSVAFMFFDRHWSNISTKLVFALTGEVRMISEQLAAAKTQAQVDDVIKSASRNLDLLVTVSNDANIGKTDKSFQKFYWFSIGTKLTENLERKLQMPFTVAPYSKEKFFEITVRLDDARAARILVPERRLASSATYVFLLFLIGSAVVLFGISALFMRNQVRPIMRLAVAAEKLGKGQDVPDFKPMGATEVRRAARAFIEMKDRLKRQMEQRTAMLSGVSHDLRTPITRLKLQLAIAKHSPEIEHMREDIEEMEKMIEGYLAFAKGEGDEAVEMTDLAVILRRIVAQARRQGYTVQDILPEVGVLIRLRPVAMERALSNIVMNACKYAPHAWVSIDTAENTHVHVTIEDDGPGIAPELREQVFRPFFRLEKSRNKKTGGVGLGLSIAQDIVHAHGGRVLLDSSEHGGLKVTIRLPV
jgi:two-component system osmolarity sensor histidine kinase EnvZ